MKRKPFTKVSEVLDYAAKCVEYGHARGESALAGNGKSVPPRADNAVRWCVIGAANRATLFSALKEEALEAIRRRVGPVVSVWSDSTPTAEVVRTLRDVAKSEREAGR